MVKIMSNKTNLKHLKPWKKGESGNPKGKPPGTKNFRDVLEKIMRTEMLAKDPFNGEMRMISNQELLMLKLVSIARSKSTSIKDLRAIETIMDRIDGKPIQVQKIEGLNNDAEIKEIMDKMSDKEACQIFMRELKNPEISEKANVNEKIKET